MKKTRNIPKIIIISKNRNIPNSLQILESSTFDY